jgi:Spy/CpxP family protein refolding chaperone
VQALVAGEKFDRARAQALVSEKTAAVNAKSPEVIAALGDFYDSLNPTQQAKVREFMQHRNGRWWHRG